MKAQVDCLSKSKAFASSTRRSFSVESFLCSRRQFISSLIARLNTQKLVMDLLNLSDYFRQLILNEIHSSEIRFLLFELSSLSEFYDSSETMAQVCVSLGKCGT